LSTPRLSRSQSEALRALLEARAANLRRELGEALHDPQAEDTIALPNRHADTDDDAVADLETDIDVASMERDARELVDVVEALSRMDHAEYGACLDCGKPIPWARLRAQPHAKRCVRCEEALERSSGARATPGL
jgi:RNA polymerase-binding transcription factor